MVEQETSSKSELAYAWIRGRIVSSVFGPGHRLVLGRLAETLEMSVVPIREAIRRLEAEGLVTYEHNVGASVAIVDEAEYVHTMQTLALVEGSAVGLALGFITSDDLDRATALNQRMRVMLDDLDAHAFTQLNWRLHAVFYERCPNPLILELVRGGWGRLSRLRDSTFAIVPTRAQHSVSEHDDLIELIRRGAETLEIEIAVRNHRLRTVDAYLAALQRGAEPFATEPFTTESSAPPSTGGPTS